MGRSFRIRCCAEARGMTAAALFWLVDRIERSRVLLAFLALLVALGTVYLLQDAIIIASLLLTELHP